jgi:uncharacterized protein YcgI (DUF1989 family)
VVDVEGGQVVDLFAFNADDVSEFASAEHTRVEIARLFPRVGEAFTTSRRRPILTLVEDTSPGVHDMLCAACDLERYRNLGVEGPHASCRDNLERAMAELGHERIVIPQPINLFQNAHVMPDGALTLEPSVSRPGDAVTLRAVLDCIVVASACPQDVVEISRGGPKDAALELLD